jgi:hypothetical protein
MAGAGRMHAVESGKDLATADDRLRRQRPAPRHPRRPPRRGPPHRHPGRPRRRLRRGVPACAGVLRDRALPLRHARRARHRTGLNAFLAAMSDEATAIVRLGQPTGRSPSGAPPSCAITGRATRSKSRSRPRPGRRDLPALRAAFEAEYSRQFSRPVPDMVIEVLNWGLSVASPTPEPAPRSPIRPPDRATHRARRTITCDLTGRPSRPPSMTARSCARRHFPRPRPDRGAADHHPSQRRFHRVHRRRRQYRDGADAMTPRDPAAGHVVPPSVGGRGTGPGAHARGLQPHRAGMRRHLRRASSTAMGGCWRRPSPARRGISTPWPRR